MGFIQAQGSNLNAWEGLDLVWWAQLLLIAAGYLVTLGLSGVIVRFFVNRPVEGTEAVAAGSRRFDHGAIIGKCENLLTLTFVLLGEYAGLAIIFAAKSLVRGDAIKADPAWYLGGTLVNLVWAGGVGLLLRLLVFGWPTG